MSKYFKMIAFTIIILILGLFIISNDAKVKIINNTNTPIKNLTICDKKNNLVTEISTIQGNSTKTISLKNKVKLSEDSKSLFLIHEYINQSEYKQYIDCIGFINPKEKKWTVKITINSIDNNGKLEVDIK